MPRQRKGAHANASKDPFVVPSFKAYAEGRLDAYQINFRKYMVRTYVGNYYKEKVLIELQDDGTVKVSDAMYAPTEEEAKAIKDEVTAIDEKGNRKIQFPRAVKADQDSLRLLIPRLQSSLYDTFPDPDDGDLITMVQERREQEDGGKFFIPWTLFSDQEWRCMEPDKLPFWRPHLKPREKRARIMIHEGVKAAKAADKIVREKLDHPWLAELELYEHWGAIGGALAPQRLDYEPLRRKKPADVVYVADNDDVGKSAVTKVSRAWGSKLKGILFDDGWPKTWDMADEVPQNFFEEGRYIGPSLRDMMRPATWAVAWKPPKTPKAKREPEVSVDFAEEWVHSISPCAYIHKDFPDRIWSQSEFNEKVAPFTGDSRIRMSDLMKMHLECQADTLCYEPGKASGCYHADGMIKFNTHCGTKIEPNKKLGFDPWLEFLNYLVPDEFDRKCVTRWLATLIALPGVRMGYSLMIISEPQGVGKSTLGDQILRPLVGPSNYTAVAENEVLQSNFNYWCAEKRLVFAHEILTGGSSLALYKKLKSLLTDPTLTVHKKYMNPYPITNYCHMGAASNYTIKIEAEDRRWLVPKITEDLRSPTWWLSFHKWLRRGGVGAILYWANEYVANNPPVSEADQAPMTTTKRLLIDDSYSEDGEVIFDALRRSMGLEENKDKDLLYTDTQFYLMVRRVIKANGDWRIKPHGVRKIARQLGLHVSEFSLWSSDWLPDVTAHSRLIVSNKNTLTLPREELRNKKLTSITAIETDIMNARSSTMSNPEGRDAARYT